MIYFITVNYYAAELTEKLIKSIAYQSDSGARVPYQMIIINNSPNDSAIYRLKSPSVLIFNTEKNLGFGKACNLGLQWVYQQNSQGIVWLINPDAYVLEDSLLKAAKFFKNYPEVSILGTTVYEPTGNVWFGGGEFLKKTGRIMMNESLSGTANDPYIPMQWVTACSLLMNLKNFQECPQFDEDYFLYYEDFDLCLRYAKQGHLVAMTQHIYVIHQPSSITSQNPGLKLQHSIFSYLLSLDKHSDCLVFWYRFLRITFAALCTFIIQPKQSIYKIKGVLMYVQFLLNQILIRCLRGDRKAKDKTG